MYTLFESYGYLQLDTCPRNAFRCDQFAEFRIRMNTFEYKKSRQSASSSVVVRDF